MYHPDASPPLAVPGSPEPRGSSPLPRLALSLAAALVALTAGLVLAGWSWDHPFLFQVHPTWPPAQSLSAAGLLLGALALALAALAARPGSPADAPEGAWPRRRRLAGQALAGLLLVGGAALALASLLGLDLGPGPLIAPGPLGKLAVAPPGLQSALCLFFAGGILALLPRPSSPRGDRLQGFLTLFLLLLVSLSVGGFVAGVPSLCRLAVAEVLGFGLLGGASAFVLWRRCPPTLDSLGRWLPQAVAVGCGVATLILWQGLAVQDRARFRRSVQSETARVAHAFRDRLPEQFAPLRTLARKWSLARPADPLPRHWKSDAASYLGEHPGCLGLAWVGPEGPPRWVETLREPSRLERDAFGDPARRDAVLRALREQPGLTLRSPGSDRNRWLVVYAPGAAPGGEGPRGGVLAVVDPQQLLSTTLNRNVAPGYAITVREGGRPLFSRLSSEREHHEEWGQQVRVEVSPDPGSWGGGSRRAAAAWTIDVWPTAEAMEKERYSLPRLALLAGLVMASLLGVMVRVGRTAIRRAAALEREIQERRQAEQALRASEAKYRALVENLEQGVFLKDRDLRFVAANRPFCEGLGCREADLIGQTDHRWYLKEQADAHLAVERSVLEDGHRVEREEKLFLASQLVRPGEQSDTLVKSQARERTVRIIRTPVRDESGATVGVLGICWDVTEQRALEEQLRQAQKMEAVGQLAGGIAHDFNNLLTAILGNLSLIKMRHAAGEPTHTLAATAEQAGMRASELTRQLVGLSRRNCHNPQALDLRVTLGEVLGLLQHTADPRIRWVVDLPADLWAVRADPGQINQVLMNLALNACDAMPEGGKLTFKAKNVTLDEASRRMHVSARPGEYVRLRVRDTGPGIPQEHLGRIFEPFFTTKQPGKGTGLGLAMAFGIVQQHKGWMAVHSVVGKGTCFEVFLPRSRERPARPPAGDEARDGEEVIKLPPPGGKATILVVDDEAPIRTLAQAALGQAGYETLLAADGQEGVDLFAREQGRIDLVLLDLRMPNLSGQETFRRLRAIDPEVRVVFVSGYSFEALNAEEQQAARGFLAKPFQLPDLLRCIRAALQDPSPEGLPVAPSRVLQKG